MLNRSTRLGVAMFVAMALPSCAHSEKSAVTPAIVTAIVTPARTPAPIASAPEWFVWSRAKTPVSTKDETTDDAQTVVLDAQGHVTSASNGITLVVEGEPWRWETSERNVDLQPCDAQNAPPETKVESARIVRVDGPRAGTETRTLFKDYFEEDHGTGDGEAALTMGAVTQSFSITASVGPYLFVREHTWMYSCGAHGFWGATPHVVDLRSGAKITLEFANTETPAAKADAIKAFNDRYTDPKDQGYSPFHDALDPEQVRYVASEPRFSGSQMSFVNIYLAGVSYVDSASAWSSYTVDADVPTQAPDPALAAQAIAPANVVVYAAEHPDRVVGGWTTR